VKNTRRVVQVGFLALVLVGVFALGANCERWCPFGGIEAAYTYATEGNMLCSLGVSNFFILGGVLLMTVLLRRAFCGYMCPLGTISEWLRVAAAWLRIPGVRVPPLLDRILALSKYAVLATVLYYTYRAGELIFRGFDPCYALISRHGEDITVWAYVTAGAIALASLFMVMPFCRWFCPLAAVLNPLSRFGLTRVKRDTSACNDCGLCAKSCPAAIPVDQVEQVTAARCISCLKCVDSCPNNATEPAALTWGPPRMLGRSWPPLVLVAVLLLCTSLAVATSYMFPVPSFIKSRGTRPEKVATVRLQIEDVTCRGRANLLFYFLERDDLYEIGYFKLEAWPGPGLATIDVTFDPTLADEQLVKQAITEPYFNNATDRWRSSTFQIEGYDQLMIAQ
jgi:NAD-dependent dihydropyrimidine dehydrogenase PreA subunit